MRKLMMLLAFFIAISAYAQETNTIDTAVYSYFSKLPSLLPSVDSVYKYYKPPVKNTPCQRYRTELKKQIGLLADQSNHKSYLLSVLSDRYDREGGRYDFTRANNAKDKILQAAIDKANGEFFRHIDDYTRTVSARMDSIYKKYKGIDIAKQQLYMYQQELPVLISKVKKALIEWNKVMNTKGYNRQLFDRNLSHPYYIQILESRALFYDRLIKLSEQVEAVLVTVAMQAESNRQ
jgi:hypothetical protein